MTHALRILGIDPGLRTTGYGVIELGAARPKLIEAGVVSPQPAQSLECRLEELHRGIQSVLRAAQPDVIVIEDLYTSYKNPRTAIMMGHARGVLCLAGAQQGLPVRTLTHSLVKRVLSGSGSARKDQINAMVTQVLGLRVRPKPNDVSDALALALAYAHRLR